MRSSPLACLLASLWSVCCYAQFAKIPDIDRAEQLSSTDAPAALELLDKLQPATQNGDDLARWLLVRGLAYCDARDESKAQEVIRRLYGMNGVKPAAYGQVIPCTVSVGYASYPLTGVAVDVWLDRAITLVDKALHQAKSRGGDRACLITLVNAETELELNAINAQVAAAAADHRVHLVETTNAVA